MKKIANEAHETAIIRKVYTDAAALDWEHTSQTMRTRQYERWLEDPLVGGILGQWMSPSEMRVWLKDGPLKEFARARAGLGDTAKYLDEHPFSAKVIVARALGPGWSLVTGSIDVKPPQCLVTDGSMTSRLFWGPEKDFKHLLWAALMAWERDENEDCLVVVFDSVASPLLPARELFMKRIAARANTRLVFVRL